MEIVFEKLLKVLFSHNYYTDQMTSDFVIEPTNACRKLLLNYCMLFRESTNGFNLLARIESKGSDSLFKKMIADEKFSFKIIPRNPYFHNFTALPLDTPVDQISHFSNLTDNQQNSDLLLSSDLDEKYVSKSDLIRLKPQLFLYGETHADGTVNVRIKDYENNIVKRDSVEVTDTRLNYYIDLRHRNPGRYKFFIKNTLKLDFYADDLLIGKKLFGIIDIHTGGSVPEGYRIIDANGKLTPQTYYIKFDHRKTYWKYLIVLKYFDSKGADKLSISYPDAPDLFKPMNSISLSDGKKVIPFISEKEIEITEKPIKGIQLKKTNSNGSKILIENLPKASVRNITPDANGNKIYSEIFVYI